MIEDEANNRITPDDLQKGAGGLKLH